jgi:hypothetical protein
MMRKMMVMMVATVTTMAVMMMSHLHQPCGAAQGQQLASHQAVMLAVQHQHHRMQHLQEAAAAPTLLL